MTRRDDRRDDDRREPFDDLFEEMTRAMKRMQEEMEEVMKQMGGEGEVRGSIFSNRPGEEPKMERFGPGSERKSTKGGHGAHIDVMDEEEEVKVIADVPGVEKKDIDLKATESILRIRASSGSRSYDEDVKLPSKVDPDSASATYNNGVLEVTLEKERSTKGKDIEIN